MVLFYKYRRDISNIAEILVIKRRAGYFVRLPTYFLLLFYARFVT